MGRIIAFDPGGTTGVVLATEYNDNLHIVGLQYTGYTWDKDIDLLSYTKDDTIIYETFFIRDPSFCTDGVKVIGALEYISYKTGCKLVIQRPTVPKFISCRYSELCKKVKFPIHSREAFYHLVYYMRENSKYSAEEIFERVGKV